MGISAASRRQLGLAQLMVGLGRDDGLASREWHHRGPWSPRRGARSSGRAGPPLLCGTVVAAPRAWTGLKRRGSTTRTLQRSSTPPSSTGTAASSGCAPGTAASSPSGQDHAGLPASAGSSPSASGVRRRRVTPSALGFARRQHITTGVMGHSCSSAAGRRIGILLRPARSSQSSWVLGPAAGPPILRPRPGAAPLRSPGGLGRASRPLWPRTTSSPSPGAAAPDRAHHPEHIILGTCAGRSSRACASFPATSSWTRAPGHPL